MTGLINMHEQLANNRNLIVSHEPSPDLPHENRLTQLPGENEWHVHLIWCYPSCILSPSQLRGHDNQFDHHQQTPSTPGWDIRYPSGRSKLCKIRPGTCIRVVSPLLQGPCRCFCREQCNGISGEQKKKSGRRRWRHVREMEDQAEKDGVLCIFTNNSLLATVIEWYRVWMEGQTAYLFCRLLGNTYNVDIGVFISSTLSWPSFAWSQPYNNDPKDSL